MKFILSIFILIFFSCTLQAQKISAVADRNKILLGEQISLQLKAEEVNTRTTFIAGWFHPDDSTGHIQVVKRNPVDTIEVNSLTTYLQNITLTSFDSGKWKLAPMQVILQDRTSGKQTKFITDTITIEVLPVDVSQLKNFHDLKDVLDVTVQKDYWMIAAVVASAIVLVILLYLIFRKKKQPAPAIAEAVSADPFGEALSALQELEKENLISLGRQKLFYSRLSGICRKYFDNRLHIRSSQSTSDEMMIFLKSFLNDEDTRTKFYQLLRLCDAVKFAKYIPGTEENNKAIPVAVKTLEHIQSFTQTKVHHV